MSTKNLREALDLLAEDAAGDEYATLLAARNELDAIEQAACDLSRLSIGDFVYSIRERSSDDRGFSGNSWEHPNVKAWGDAAMLMDAIAKERKP